MSGEGHKPVNEYEREPLPPAAQLGLKSFVGQYAGEHTAGTELMLGPLFLASGVSASDLVLAGTDSNPDASGPVSSGRHRPIHREINDADFHGRLVLGDSALNGTNIRGASAGGER